MPTRCRKSLSDVSVLDYRELIVFYMVWEGLYCEGKDRTMVTGDEAGRGSLYRAGAIALLIAGALYLLLVPLLTVVAVRGEFFQSSIGLMDQIISRPMMPRVNAVIFTIIDLSTLVGFSVLMLTLRTVDRCWPVVAIVPISVAMLFDIQDGFIDWAMVPSYAAYPDAPEQVQSAYRVVAEVIYQYIYEVVSPFIAIMIGVSVALMSWAMRKSMFAPWTAYLGFAAAAVAVIGGVTTFFPLLLSVGVWYVAVGIQLLGLTRAGAPRGPQPSPGIREG